MMFLSHKFAPWRISLGVKVNFSLSFIGKNWNFLKFEIKTREPLRRISRNLETSIYDAAINRTDMPTDSDTVADVDIDGGAL